MPAMWRILTGVCLLLVSLPGFADLKWNMPEGVTEVSRDVHQLHMVIFYICVAIGIVVFSVMIWSIIHHRKSKGWKASHFHENTTVEIIWTAIPFFILVGMAIPATSTLKAMYDTAESDIDIQVTGYQWKWRYQYLDQGVDFFSNLSTSWDAIENRQDKGEHYLLEVDNPVVVPIKKKIRFLFTANDVIHSWWVPELAIKKDAIPGFINEAWTIIEKPGIYRGQCTELCGKNHGYMPVVLYAVAQETYDKWIASQLIAQQEAKSIKDMSYDELYALGEQVYKNNCAACHMASGEGMPGVFPALHGSPFITDKNPEKQVNIILKGKPGTAMAAFAEQLSISEIAAVVTYERNAWGDQDKQSVTPAQVHALKTQAALNQ
jgi:cytochrome c oxidase subunit 2